MQLLANECLLEDFEFVLRQATRTLWFPLPGSRGKGQCDWYCSKWLGDFDVLAFVLISLYASVPW